MPSMRNPQKSLYVKIYGSGFINIDDLHHALFFNTATKKKEGRNPDYQHLIHAAIMHPQLLDKPVQRAANSFDLYYNLKPETNVYPLSAAAERADRHPVFFETLLKMGADATKARALRKLVQKDLLPQLRILLQYTRYDDERLEKELSRCHISSDAQKILDTRDIIYQSFQHSNHYNGTQENARKIFKKAIGKGDIHTLSDIALHFPEAVNTWGTELYETPLLYAMHYSGPLTTFPHSARVSFRCLLALGADPHYQAIIRRKNKPPVLCNLSNYIMSESTRFGSFIGSVYATKLHDILREYNSKDSKAVRFDTLYRHLCAKQDYAGLRMLFRQQPDQLKRIDIEEIYDRNNPVLFKLVMDHVRNDPADGFNVQRPGTEFLRRAVTNIDDVYIDAMIRASWLPAAETGKRLIGRLNDAKRKNHLFSNDVERYYYNRIIEKLRNYYRTPVPLTVEQQLSSAQAQIRRLSQENRQLRKQLQDVQGHKIIPKKASQSFKDIHAQKNDNRKIVWLIRHGESAANAGLATSRPDTIPLTEKGRRQAVETSDKFTTAPHLIVMSPFSRTQETAAPTRRKFPHVATAIWPIEEITYLSPAKFANTTAAERAPAVKTYWNEKDPDYCDGDGAESFAQFARRVRGMLQKIQDNDVQFTAVFTHGLVMRAARYIINDPHITDRDLMQKIHTEAGKDTVVNCEIIALTVDDKGVRLAAPSKTAPKGMTP